MRDAGSAAGQNGAMRPRATDVEITIALRWAVVGAASLAAGVLLGVVLAVVVDPIDLDRWWNGLVGGVVPSLQPLSLVMNAVGGGWIATYAVPLSGALLLVLARRTWSGLFFLAATALSAGVVQVLKSIFGRVRPEDMLVISDHGSFPSGHTANAATLVVVAVVLFPRLWVALVGAAWVLLMAFSRTQVHAHWFTDTVGGTLVGAGVALLVAAAFVLPILRERDR